MKRLGVMLLAVAALCTAGCHRDAQPKSSRPVIGVTLLTQTHAFYKDLEQGLRDEAAKRNLDLVVVSAEMDPARQASQIEDFVAQRVAAILVTPCDSSAVVPNLAGPADAGIPVFTADIAARGGKVVSHIASDNIQGGRLAAQALARFIGDRGRVLIIDQPTVASVQDRVRGFDEEMKRHPGITIVGRPNADGQRARAMSVMEDMLQAHRDLKGVFGINDDSALGALAVLDAAGRSDIAVVGYDATPEARAAIERGGPLKADVIQHPKEIGRKAIEMIARHLAGESVPATVSIDVGVVDAAALQHQ
ncbi:MAG TPA: substrate-binding domain-containing protein [Vicinamibacterales bacterium]|nr:substrate-binding domain-containing protein [Vicinamibacterales bacterium]